ncbi:MAG: cytochrome biosis protein [Acidimicrobiaceae bacterium]|nr:cytochrome biosis protein [Acidimicrobiaceae bacterium]
MSAATLAPAARSRNRRAGFALTSRWSWMLLALVVAGALVFGSTHSGSTTRADRIRYLDSVIKCPVCEDVSIAGSNAQQARNLRAKVVELVDAGRTDAQIEKYVVAQFGTDGLLRPTSPVIWLLPIAGGAVAVLALGVALSRRRSGSYESAPGSEDEAIVVAAIAGRSRAGTRNGANASLDDPFGRDLNGLDGRSVDAGDRDR